VKAVQSASALVVEGVSKSYLGRRGRYGVLDAVHLDVPEGAILALLAPSGAGKSTLLNILAGLEPPDRGTVRFPGRPERARPPIAYMQQKDLLLPWRTVWDNILLGPELRSGDDRARLAPEAERWLQALHLDEFRDAHPTQLSGGMRQRAALIRTLLCGQEILLLDEPFGAVDALTRRRLQRHLLDIWERLGKTVVLVTHDVDEALLLATRVVLLSSRPARVVESLEIAMPHRGRVQSPDMLRLKTRILDSLEKSDAAERA
jgi:ABC-type nitrate/sulfonate/bicarbonate transport system ATPase subunit